MRTTMLALAGAMMLAGCGNTKAEKQAQADANAAGFVPPSVTSRVDYGTAMDRRFRALDRDGDDVIGFDELPARNARLKALDRNGDGRITSSEFSEGMLSRFDKADLNKDATVTSDEREALRNMQ